MRRLKGHAGSFATVVDVAGAVVAADAAAMVNVVNGWGWHHGWATARGYSNRRERSLGTLGRIVCHFFTGWETHDVCDEECVYPIRKKLGARK